MSFDKPTAFFLKLQEAEALRAKMRAPG